MLTRLIAFLLLCSVVVGQQNILTTPGGVVITTPSSNLVVTPPWTPADLSGPNPIAWYDGDDASTITESAGLGSRWEDKSTNGNDATNGVGINQPTYTASNTNANDMGTLGSSVSTGKIGLDTPSMTAKHIYAIVYYKDGTNTTFGTYDTLISNGSGARARRIMGSLASDSWYLSWHFNDSGTYVNGSTSASNVALPMPLTMLRFVASTARTQSYALGYNDEVSGRTWVGGYGEFVFTDGTETTDEQNKIEGYLMWKWGRQGNLPSDHPWRYIRP